jgi:hypothetical protein
MLRHTKLKSANIALFVFLTLCGCGKSASNTNTATTTESSPQATTQSSPLTGFAKDLQYIKNGRYSYIWIFSRKDGKPLDKDDSAFLRANAPQVVDWVITDEGKKVIAGTNFNLEEGNLGQLKKRFIAEDWTGR